MSRTNTLGSNSTIAPEPDSAQVVVAFLRAAKAPALLFYRVMKSKAASGASLSMLVSLLKKHLRPTWMPLSSVTSRGDIVSLNTSLVSSDPAWPNGPNHLPTLTTKLSTDVGLTTTA